MSSPFSKRGGILSPSRIILAFLVVILYYVGSGHLQGSSAGEGDYSLKEIDPSDASDASTTPIHTPGATSLEEYEEDDEEGEGKDDEGGDDALP